MSELKHCPGCGSDWETDTLHCPRCTKLLEPTKLYTQADLDAAVAAAYEVAAPSCVLCSKGVEAVEKDKDGRYYHFLTQGGVTGQLFCQRRTTLALTPADALRAQRERDAALESAAELRGRQQLAHDLEFYKTRIENAECAVKTWIAECAKIKAQATKLEADNAALREALEWISGAGERQNAMLHRNHFVFLTQLDKPDAERTPAEMWEKLAFTMHGDIWEIADKARALLGETPAEEKA